MLGFPGRMKFVNNQRSGKMTQAGLLAVFETGIGLIFVVVIPLWACFYWYAKRGLSTPSSTEEILSVGVVDASTKQSDPFQALPGQDMLISPGTHPPQEAQRQISGTCTAVEVQGERVRFALKEYPGTWFMCEDSALVQCFEPHCRFPHPCLQPGDTVKTAVLILDEDELGDEAQVDWGMVHHQKPLTRGGEHE